MKRSRSVVVSSPVELTDEQKKSIQSLVVSGVGKHAIPLTFKVEPEMLGGLVIHFGSKKIDLSLDGKLQSINEYLKNHGST